MALFDADTAGVLWDSIALPNAFVIEYMPTAPENYVKVYIYGLLYARFACAGEGLTVQALAKELGMEESDVFSAFQYWERARLVSRTQDKPPRYHLPERAAGDDGAAGRARWTTSIWSSPRRCTRSSATGASCTAAKRSCATSGWSSWACPARWCCCWCSTWPFTRGVNFSFKAAQKVALEMKERNIVKLEDAEQFFARSQAAWDGTRKVLRRISKYRPPTTDEIDLYLKWTQEWGFAPKAVEAACAEMTGGDPSFKYLDSILRGIHERSGRKQTTAAQLEKQLSKEKEESADIREVLNAAGLKIGPNHPTIRESYQKMLSMVSHEAIVLAAQGDQPLQEKPVAA